MPSSWSARTVSPAASWTSMYPPAPGPVRIDSATQEVSRDYALPVTAIATLADILATLRGRPGDRAHVERIEDYRRRYGVT